MKHMRTRKPVPVHEHIDGCRWPIGDHPILFCNSVVVERTNPYCDKHSKLSYVPVRVRAKRTKDNRKTW
jgi:hypothetical protein